jgi:hypothetical protein
MAEVTNSMYQWLIEGSSFTLGSAAATLAWIRVKRYRSVASTETGRESFSADRYEPMKRLLSEEDFEFLKNKPGVQPAMIRRLRAERRKIFRAYLCELASDFNRLHREARLMLANAPEEYSDLVGVVMATKVKFWSALAGVEVRLAVHAIGIGRIDLSALLGSIEALNSAVHPASEPGLESI